MLPFFGADETHHHVVSHHKTALQMSNSLEDGMSADSVTQQTAVSALTVTHLVAVQRCIPNQKIVFQQSGLFVYVNSQVDAHPR